jgi:predicted dehydrogenase
MFMSQPIRWGLLAAGGIARVFAHGVQHSETGVLAAVASRDPDKAKAFAEEYDIPASYGSYEALLADPQVDAVYISTPHPMHKEWAIKAAQAGKHILCEKPMTLNAADTTAIIDAARTHQVFLMEAFMYRCHPQTAKVLELLREGILGDVQAINASFSFGNGFKTSGRLWEQKLGGGAILDVGGYTASYVCLVAGAVEGTTFAVPAEIKGVGLLSPDTGVDALASAVLRFNSGILATCSCGICVRQENCVQIFGTKGWLKIPTPYAAARESAVQGKILFKPTGSDTPEVITVDTPLTSYTYEADVCGRAILAANTEAAPPAMTWQDSIELAKVQDAWRKEIGLVYDLERAGQ